MRKTLLSLALLLTFYSAAFGQILSLPANPQFQNVFITGTGCVDYGAGDVTLCRTAADALTLAGGQLVLPAGTSALPSLLVSTGGGIYSPGAGFLDVNSAPSITVLRIGTYNVDFGVSSLNFGASLGSVDATFNREAAAVFQLGADAASPVAQTLKGADGVGTDKPGGDMTYAPGRPTGTGVPGKIFLATSTTGGGSSSSQQALVNRVTISEVGVAPSVNGLLPLGSAAVGWKGLYLDYTNTATVGAVTINKASGRAIIAAAASSVVVTNNLATAASRCLAVLSVNDATALSIRSCITAANSLTITTNGVAAANARVDWILVNAD